MNAPVHDPFELTADAQLVHLLAQRFFEDEGVDLTEDRTALLRLLQAARAARRDLAADDHADVSVPLIAVNALGQPLSLTDTITRRDQRRAGADDQAWATFDRLEAILFEQRAQERAAAPLPLAAAGRAAGDAVAADDDAGAGDDAADRPAPASRRRRWLRWGVRGLAAAAVLLTLAIGWLALTAPLSKSLEPPTPPSITLLADDGRTPIARRGAIIGAPVDAARLPARVVEPFLAIEDRRFYTHWGVDPRGIARALWHNTTSDARSQGASTITQQLAKNAFLDSDRTVGRKLREVMIAFWLEAWLTKDQILSRYLSNVYFGDNVYGLQAAARHFFARDADELTVGQAAMLAGLVKAPSRLNPSDNLPGARARARVVIGAMVQAGYLTAAQAAAVAEARPRRNVKQALPTGTYFADWVLPQARETVGEGAGEIKTEARVTTTLDRDIQAAAERAVKRAGLARAQVAVVAMRPDGRVVAMVGGRDYAASPFNRATQARRQPGSAFKLFVYLAALQSGMTPETLVDDEPVTIADWSPKNNDGRYLGRISLRRAFARSSNVVAARLIQEVGYRTVIREARRLGVTTPLPEEASIALGTATGSLLELTAAYAAVANGRYPVAARGVEQVRERGWLDGLTGGERAFDGRVRTAMLDLLRTNVESGTGHAAALSVEAFGKTGTTQDNRDALFVGFAEDLVVGVWVGNDDNTPNPGLSGGGLPARIWKDVMMQALDVGPAEVPEAENVVDNVSEVEEPGFDPDSDPVGNLIDDAVPAIQGQLDGLGLNLTLGRDGSVAVTGRDAPARRREPAEPEREPADRNRRE